MNKKILEYEVLKVLENDICSAQALDEPADRKRVQKEIVKMLVENENIDSDRVKFEIYLIKKHDFGASNWPTVYGEGYVDGLKRALELMNLKN